MKKLLMVLMVLLVVLCQSVVAAKPDISSSKDDSLVVPEHPERSIRDFLTPDGRFDLEAARRSGYQGPLDIKGFESTFNTSSGQPVFYPASPADDPDDIYWDNSISPCIGGVGGNISAIAVFNGKLVVGGSFFAAGCVVANNIASWDGTTWLPLGSGTNTTVYALTVFNNMLIAGGMFTSAGGVSANYIASWNGSTWSPLGSGMSSTVRALCVYNNKLIAGGYFNMAGSVTAWYIASWNGSSWYPLGSGMDYIVLALTVYNNKLIAGGYFTTAGGISANYIASWDGTSWSSLGSGMNESVQALAVYDNKLIAGGEFTIAGGVNANYITFWNGTSWSPLGSGMDTTVYALTVYNNNLIAGGRLYVDSWNGTSWSPLGWTINGYVYAAITYDNKLIAAGDFNLASGIAARNIASWNGSTWSRLGSGTDGSIFSLSTYNNKIIAGGLFNSVGGTNANSIASWNGITWSPLGSGMGIDGYYYPQVVALAVYDNKLIVGGFFTTAGGISAIYIASWDGTTWSPFGSSTNGTVCALTVYNNKLIAGGSFTTAGGVSTNYIASWDGTTWSPLGSGMNNPVYALAVYNNNLIAGGLFTTAGGVSANYIASWNGTSWSPLGSGMGSNVHAFTVYDNKLIVGGWFTSAGGISANRIAAWDGTAWSPMGSGMNSGIGALTVFGNMLIAGGDFTSAGGSSANRIAYWNGTTWSPMGSGTNDYVHTLVVYNNRLFVGGNFTTAGDKVAAAIVEWTTAEFPQRTLNVASSPASGVSITVSPNNCPGGTITPFSCTYANGTTVTLTAPPTYGGNTFQKWQKNGVDWGFNTTSPTLTMDANYSVTAVYVVPQRTLNVASSPSSGVSITVSPSNCPGGTITPFSCTYANGTVVTLTAPATAGGNVFQKWQKNGVDWGFGTTSPTLTMDADYSVTAVYVSQVLCFDAAVNYTVGSGPRSVFAADLDGDGDQDLAVANVNSYNVSVLKNNGDGTYAAAVNYAASFTPSSVIAADLDGDGDKDLAVAGDPVMVLRNNGNGTFALTGGYPAGNGPTSVFAADLDGDGDKDLAVANYGSNNVSVLKNNGNGTFASAVNYAAGSAPSSVIAADLDGDGDKDLAVTNYGSNNVSVLKNNGNGTFTSAVNYAASFTPSSVIAADLDGDGDKDLAVAGDPVMVLRNNGNGTFALTGGYPAGNGPTSVFAADLDGDGDKDLAVANYGSNNVSVLKNNGNGTFASAVNFVAGNGLRSVFAAALNGDRSLDMVVASETSNDVSVLLNCGGPTTFALTVASSPISGVPITPSPSNCPGGTITPFTCTYTSGTLVTLTAPDTVGVNVFQKWRKDGIDWGFSPTSPTLTMDADYSVTAVYVIVPIVIAQTPTPNAPNVPRSSQITATFNIDMNPATINGNTFIVAGNKAGPIQGVISYNAGNRTATFTPSALYPAGEIVSVALTTGIESASGVPLAQGYTWSFTTAVSGSTGFFGPATTIPSGNADGGVATADFNGDGYVDLVQATGNNVSVILNNTLGGFAPYVLYQVTAGSGCAGLAVADYDGDGDVDIAILQTNYSYDNYISILLNDGNGVFTVQPSSSYGASNGRSLCSADFNADGHPDLAVGLQAHYVLPAPLDLAYFAILFNNGNATFDSSGSYPIHTWSDISGLWTADLDGDGFADVATTIITQANLALFLNNGHGIFQFDTDIANPQTPLINDMEAADFNGDSRVDIVMFFNGNMYYEGKISFFENIGSGQFILNTTLPAGWWYRSLASGDIDGDGDIDLLVANGSPPWYAGNFATYMNFGNFDFRGGRGYTTGVNPTSIAPADLDNDGDLDLVVVCSQANIDGSVLIFKNLVCVDTDGDGYGDPGHPENQCPADNCPWVYNPSQSGGCTFSGETPAGENISSEAGPVFVTYQNVTQAGTTDLSISETGPGVEPVGFDIVPLSLPAFYNVSTTALYEGTIEVCFSYDDFILTPSAESSLSLLHFDGVTWQNITTSVDVDSNTVCGLASSLSPFVMVLPAAYLCGDANGSGLIELGDVVYLITYLYKNGPAPDPLLSGDANCSGEVELGDVVYLITYLYKAGSPPSCK